MNAPNKKWINDWKCGVDPAREKELGKYFVEVFSSFWEDTSLGCKSKTTINRYSGALFCLGGYLVKEGIDFEVDKSACELLMENLDEYEGPLIHLDNETWQKEIDTVCKKLFKYLKSK